MGLAALILGVFAMPQFGVMIAYLIMSWILWLSYRDMMPSKCVPVWASFWLMAVAVSYGEAVCRTWSFWSKVHSIQLTGMSVCLVLSVVVMLFAPKEPYES